MDWQLGGMKKLAAAAWITASVAACGGPELTREALEVRTVTDASTCTFIESAYLEGRPQVVQDYVKRNVHAAGGDSYKIVTTNKDAAMGVDIAGISYEAYRCRS